MSLIDRWTGADEEWERPGPDRAQRRNDVWLAIAALVVVALGARLYQRSLLHTSGSLSWRRALTLTE